VFDEPLEPVQFCASLDLIFRLFCFTDELRNASRGTAHMFIVNPLQGARDDDEGFFANLFSTHPPLPRRIERLRTMLGEAGGEAPPAGAAAAPTSRG
jgi:hypothetical protein